MIKTKSKIMKYFKFQMANTIEGYDSYATKVLFEKATKYIGFCVLKDGVLSISQLSSNRKELQQMYSVDENKLLKYRGINSEQCYSVLEKKKDEIYSMYGILDSYYIFEQDSFRTLSILEYCKHNNIHFKELDEIRYDTDCVELSIANNLAINFVSKYGKVQ